MIGSDLLLQMPLHLTLHIHLLHYKQGFILGLHEIGNKCTLRYFGFQRFLYCNISQDNLNSFKGENV